MSARHKRGTWRCLLNSIQACRVIFTIRDGLDAIHEVTEPHTTRYQHGTTGGEEEEEDETADESHQSIIRGGVCVQTQTINFAR